MRCPFCGHPEDKVVDSRESREGDSIRRRRECLGCSRRFTSYERVEEVPVVVVKKDGRREVFDAGKLLKGVSLACQKRPVSLARLEELVKDLQARLVELPDREIRSRDLGEMVMEELRQVDHVAYVRFASVYRDFKDLSEFVTALDGLMKRERTPAPPPSDPGPRGSDASPSKAQAPPLFPGLDAPSLPGGRRRR
ncbi:MAG: transcriptional repressor NrdR [Acidobacteria bacterium]|nr:transcriptional repressor NrdR [Acidobacteriota bacterium]